MWDLFNKKYKEPKHITKFIAKTKAIASKYNITQIHAECFEVNYANYHPHCNKCSSYQKCLEIKKKETDNE